MPSAHIQTCIDTQTVDITLVASSTISGDSILVYWPLGINYAVGSVLTFPNAAGITIVESNTSIPNAPSFSFLGTMNAGDSCVFRIGRSADCRAYDGLLSYWDDVNVTYNDLNVFPNSVTVNNSGSVVPFVIKTAFFTFGSIPSVQGDLGDIITRNITIQNSGQGCATDFEFYTVTTAMGVQINQIALTALVQNPTTTLTSYIVLTPDAVNGDTSFYTLDVEAHYGVGTKLCNGSEIILEETIEILTCFSNLLDGQTGYGAYRECSTLCQSIETTTANVSISPGVPNLTFTSQSTNNGPDCFDSLFTKTFRITNDGIKDALNVNFDFDVKASTTSATRFIANSSTVTLSTGGGPSPITPSTSTPLKVSYMIASIPAGTYIEIQINVEHPCPSTCGAYVYDGYNIDNITYSDACNRSHFGNNRSLIHYKEFNALNFIESNPPAIANGLTRTFSSTVATIIGLSTTSTLFWEVILPPCGVVFNNNSGDINWGGIAPTSIIVSGDTIRAEFAVPNKNRFNNIPFNIVLTGACGSCNVNQSISKRLLVNPCSTNSNHCKICLYEITENLKIEQCTTGGSCTGAAVKGFQFVRTNLGLPDNNQDRLPDASGTLDSNKINRSRYIVMDTAEATINATVFISSGNPILNHAYGEFTIDDNWRFLDASIEVFDKSTGTSFTCTGATATSTISGGGTKRNYVIDVSPSTLAATCPHMSGFAFEDGDSIVIHANLVNILNGTNIFSGTVYPINFYVSEVANPPIAQQLSCGGNAYSEIYTIYNINPGLDIATITPFGSCGLRQVDLEFEAKSGANIQNLDIFPNEWRPIAYPDTVRMVKPASYNYVSARLSSFLGVTEGIAIEPLDPNADTLVFVVGQLYQPGGLPSNSQALIPDGIERSEVQVFLQATCATPNNVDEPITMIMDAFHPLPQLEALQLLDTAIIENSLNWNKPNIAITSVSSQTAEGTSSTFEWTVRLNNTSSGSAAANAFLSAATPSNNVSITTIEHIKTNGTAVVPRALTQVNNIWEFGDVNQNVFYDLRISATYTQCQPDTLFLLAGFDCPAYPTSLSAYNTTCELDSLPLYTDPKTAKLQFTPNVPSLVNDICDTLTYSFTLNSAGLANVINPKLGLWIPPGIILLEDPTIEYPLGTAPRPFPLPNYYDIDLGTADAQIPGTHSIATNGLLGTIEANNINERQLKISFRFRTSCDFISGDTWQAMIAGLSPCGDFAEGDFDWYIGPPISIPGLGAPYKIETEVTLDSSVTCMDPVQSVLIEMIPNGASTNHDTGFYTLPENIVYAGNFDCTEVNGTLCPTFEGVITSPNGTSVLVVKYPNTWTLGDTINFSFDINTASFQGCSPSERITINHTVTIPGPTCDADGIACGDVKVSTGQADLTFSVEKADFEITNTSAQTNVVTLGQSYSLTFDITNNGLDAAAGLITEFYCADSLGNSTGVLLYSHSVSVAIANNQTITENVVFTTPTSCDNLSGIVILISETTSTSINQCICEDERVLLRDITKGIDLPVDWLFFNAKKTSNNAALLTWGTATEINSLGFEIEHALPTTGLPEFEMIDFVESIGSPVIGAHYSYDVRSLAPGVHYFRLRQIDTDGSEAYSETRAVVITGSQDEFKIYPTLINPDNQVLYLYSPEEGDIVVEIYSILGQESAILYTGNVVKNSLNEISLDTHQFPSGHYVVRVRTSKTLLTQKISIIR
jgi:hypothetical protein